MREILEIVAAFESLRAAGKPAALATVIGVEGSSYRRPGARMLVGEDGRTWGGVSGGCLERDVAARARGVISVGRPIICRYDTGDDEVPSVGASTGCGGAVELFLQSVSASSPGPLPQLSRVLQTRLAVTIATVIRAAGSLAGSEGTCLAIDENATTPAASHAWHPAAIRAARDVPDIQRPRIVSCHNATGSAELFVEHILPPQALVIFGAGPDAVPLASIAKTLGWRVSVVGARPATGMSERFAMADALHVTGSDDPADGVPIPLDAAVIVMTHNIARDRAVLANLPGGLRYLGVLGPRQRTQRIFSELPDASALTNAYSPVGLDLGAQTPEEIALSMVAEIQAVIRAASSASLRDCPGPIHPRPIEPTTPQRAASAVSGSACAI